MPVRCTSRLPRTLTRPPVWLTTPTEVALFSPRMRSPLVERVPPLTLTVPLPPAPVPMVMWPPPTLLTAPVPPTLSVPVDPSRPTAIQLLTVTVPALTVATPTAPAPWPTQSSPLTLCVPPVWMRLPCVPGRATTVLPETLSVPPV